MVSAVNYQHVMYFMLIHQFLYVGNLGVRADRLWRACHDVAHRAVEELCVPLLHCTSDITVGNHTLDATVLYGDA